MKCLNTHPDIKACYVSGAGAAVPGECVAPAKKACKARITKEKSSNINLYNLIEFLARM